MARGCSSVQGRAGVPFRKGGQVCRSVPIGRGPVAPSQRSGLPTPTPKGRPMTCLRRYRLHTHLHKAGMQMLQPCPFCGNSRRLSLALADPEGFGGARRVYCACGGRGPVGISADEAAEKWNWRSQAIESELQEALAALRADEDQLPEPVIRKLLEIYRQWRRGQLE